MRWAPGAIGRAWNLFLQWAFGTVSAIPPRGLHHIRHTLRPPAVGRGQSPIYGSFVWRNGDWQYPFPGAMPITWRGAGCRPPDHSPSPIARPASSCVVGHYRGESYVPASGFSRGPPVLIERCQQATKTPGPKKLDKQRGNNQRAELKIKFENRVN